MNNLDAAINFTLFYILIVVISLLFGAFGKMEDSKKRVYIFIIFTVFASIIALKDYTMGNDTYSYVYLFNKTANFSTPIAATKASGMESGYIIFNWLVSRIITDPHILFALIAIFVCISFGIFTYKYADNPGLFVCLFVGILHFDFFVSAMRQSMAIAFLLFAYDFLVKRKHIPFILLTLTACLFHNSSIIFLIFYLLVLIQSNKEKQRYVNYILTAVVGVCFIFFDKLFEIILIFFPRYSYYVGSERLDGEPRLSIILKLIVFLLLHFIPQIFEKDTVDTSDNCYISGDCASKLILGILLISLNATAITRLAPSLTHIVLIHYSNRIGFKSNQTKALFTYFTLLAFFIYGLVLVVLKTPEWHTTYPFKFYFS